MILLSHCEPILENEAGASQVSVRLFLPDVSPHTLLQPLSLCTLLLGSVNLKDQPSTWSHLLFPHLTPLWPLTLTCLRIAEVWQSDCIKLSSVSDGSIQEAAPTSRVTTKHTVNVSHLKDPGQAGTECGSTGIAMYVETSSVHT